MVNDLGCNLQNTDRNQPNEFGIKTRAPERLRFLSVTTPSKS